MLKPYLDQAEILRIYLSIHMAYTLSWVLRNDITCQKWCWWSSYTALAFLKQMIFHHYYNSLMGGCSGRDGVVTYTQVAKGFLRNSGTYTSLGRSARHSVKYVDDIKCCPHYLYCKTCLKWPFKKKIKYWLSRPIIT